MARRRRLETLTGWSMMWIICMFDIPVRTKTEMRKATRFRNLSTSAFARFKKGTTQAMHGRRTPI